MRRSHLVISLLIVLSLIGCVQQTKPTPVVQPIATDVDQVAAREFVSVYRAGLAEAAQQMSADHAAKKFVDVESVDQTWGTRAKAAHLTAQQKLIDRIDALNAEDPNDPRLVALWSAFAKEWGRHE